MKQQNLNIAIVIVAIVSLTLTVQAKSDENFRIGFILGGDFGLRINQIASIENFPEYMRYVPIHPDDAYKVPLENNAPIPDDKIKMSFLNCTGGFYLFGLGSRISLGRLKLMIEARLISSSSFKSHDEVSSLSPESASMRERDYLLTPGSSKRGYGTALTYYGVNYSSSGPNYVVELELELKEGSESSLNLLCGYSELFSCLLKLEQGWDRNNRLELRKSFRLQEFNQANFYTGLSFDWSASGFEQVRFFLILGGSVIKNQKIISKEVSVHYNKTPIFLKLGMTFFPSIKIF